MDVQKVIQIAENEVGYCEKKTKKNLDDKTANAGYNNYTKYWKEIYPAFQGQAWCDCFVKYCFVKAYGLSDAKKLLCSNTFSYACETSLQYFKKKGQFVTKNPKVGDQIFFWNSNKTKSGHTGIVYKVDSAYVYTIEGNTSSTAGVVSNGGCVAKKKYALNNTRIKGYGRPNYKVSNSTTTTEKPLESVKNDVNEYYPKYSGNSSKIDEVLKAIGVPSKYIGSYTKRKPIAAKNGYSNYSGTASQNLGLIDLAKRGKLKKA